MIEKLFGLDYLSQNAYAFWWWHFNILHFAQSMHDCVFYGEQ